MTAVQGLLLGISVLVFIYLGRRHVQARVVLMNGLLLDHRRPRRRAGPGLAVPRLLHGRPCSTAGCTSSASSSGPIYRLLGTSPEQEQTWKRYAGSRRHLLRRSPSASPTPSSASRVRCPLNPQHFGAVGPALGLNTATSFVTNTNWQNYGGETTMSYFSQIGALTVQQFVTPGRRHRGGARHRPRLLQEGTRRPSATSGSTSPAACSTSCSRSPSSAGIIFVGQGAVQTLAGPVNIHNALNGVTQTIARGPDRLHGGHQAARAPTAAGSSTSTRPIPSRTRPASPTCSPSSCCCASRSP